MGRLDKGIGSGRMADFYVGRKSKLLFASMRDERFTKKKIITPTDTTDPREEYYPWGDDNDFPNAVKNEISDSSIINPNLHFRSCHIYAGELRYGVMRGYTRVGVDYIPDFEPIISPQVEEWLDMNNINAYYHEILKDLLYWWHGAPVLRLNEKKTYISNLVVADWTHCRLSNQDGTTGEIKYIYRSPDWPSATKENWKKYPLVNRYYDSVGSVKNSKENSSEFIYPLTIYSIGKIYYQEPAWMSIINSKWLSVARKVVEFKEYFLAQQIGAMYVVKIPYGFWTWKYSDWEAKPELQEERREATIDQWDKKISGVENTGKILALTFKPGSETEETTEFKIEPLSGNKMFDGVHIEDSQEAASNIFTSLAFNQEILGSRPGKKSGGGSGSNIREGADIEIISNQLFRDFAIEVLNFIARFNGWKHDGLQIKFQASSILTRTANLGGPVKTASPSTTPIKESQK